MRRKALCASLALAAALLVAPALAAEPLTLECEWQKVTTTESNFDSTKKRDSKVMVTFIFNFDKGDVAMEGVSGTPSDLRASASAISFCIDGCAKIGPFDRNSDDGPLKVTAETGRLNINRLTGAISWARTEQSYQGVSPYKTVTYEYAGACKKAAARTPLF